jgi:HD-like signal output (HDOD) protein
MLGYWFARGESLGGCLFEYARANSCQGVPMLNASEQVGLDDWRTHLRQHFEKGEFDLPVLPDVAVKILQGATDELVDIDELCALIHRDQMLASHVLRLANSALFSTGRKIVSLEQALLRLGLITLRELVSAVAFRSRLFCVPEYESMGGELWRCSAATAAFCREIASIQQCDRESLFLCGLLHAVGKPIALLGILDVRKKYSLPLESATALLLVEEFHMDLGARLASRWSLPDAVAEVIVCYQQPEKAGEFRSEAMLVALARHLALAAVSAKEDAPPPGDLPQLPEDMTPDDLSRLWGRREKMLSFADALGAG